MRKANSSNEIMGKFSLSQIEAVLHILFWLIYFFYPLIKFGEYTGYQLNWSKSATNLCIAASVVYIINFFYARFQASWILISFFLIFFSGVIYFNCIYNTSNCDCSLKICLINKGVELVSIIILFLAVLTFKKNILNQQALQKSEEERIRAELRGLKAQVNPHFLFNTLNMLYANAIEKDKPLADNILKLSDNLHYIMHEGVKQMVSLEKEISFIEAYISLQKERLGDKIDVNLRVQADNPSTNLPPLLLIPFIENAFKYTSTMKGNNLSIDIRLLIENKIMDFEVNNAFDPSSAARQATTLKSSGIGIKNVRKRLMLLYPEKFSLITGQKGNSFSVKLKIDQL